MSETPDDTTNVLSFLRAQFAQVHQRLDSIEGKLSEVAQRTGILELTTACLHRDIGSLIEVDAFMSTRLDRIAAHLDRVERGSGGSESALFAHRMGLAGA